MSRPKASQRPPEAPDIDPVQARKEALEDFSDNTIDRTPGLVPA